MAITDPAKYFDANYFAKGCGSPYQRTAEWLDFFDAIASRIASDINPETVLDAGCAFGFLVENLRKRNIQAFGVDISDYAIQNVHSDIQPYVTKGSVTEPFAQHYDLIVSIEVLEHLQKHEAEKAVENLCQHTEDILFSSTPFDYKEATHFNVQPPEYWAECFARNGFFRDIDFDTSFITPWAVRFRKKQESVIRMAREYERKYFMLEKENSDLRDQVLEMRSEINGYQDLLVAKDNQLNEILTSRSWRLINKFQKIRLMLIPKGSRLEKWLLHR